MTELLSSEAQQIIHEEETLLARVLETLKNAPPPVSRNNAQAELAAQFKELRDEAAVASERDLPSLFQQMYSLRALVDREAPQPRPDLATPYFAHLKLRDRVGSRDYLLGRATFANTKQDVRIVDWRYAPIARIFYGYQEGDEFEETFPGGVSNGVIEARRILVVERGVLTRIMAGPILLQRSPDGVWTTSGATMLGGGAGTATRAGALGVGVGAAYHPGKTDVTALLDVEQFEAINIAPEKPLLVLGSAGSGKTTVALHRLAHLAFEDPDRYPPFRMRVVVPEEGLARLTRRLLTPLGFGKVKVETLAAWVYRVACEAFEVKYIKLAPDTPALVSRLKEHPALLPLLLARVGEHGHGKRSLRSMKAKFSEPLTDRSFLQSVVDAAKGDLPTTVIEQTVRHTMLQLVTTLDKQYEGYDTQSLQTLDGKAIESGTADELAESFDLEDLALMLFLKARSGGLSTEQLAHLVLDETEDFSLFELEVLGRQLGGNGTCTLAGDELQQTESGFSGWDSVLDAVGAKDAAICKLQVSYRCPRPVVELAQHILGKHTDESRAGAYREGVPVGYQHFPDEPQSALFLSAALRDLVEREPNASVGVIASSTDTAKRISEELGALSQVRLVVDGEFNFEPGIDVCDVDSVKGLEFDYVIVPDANAGAYPNNDEARRRLHVAITRASHQLWVVSSGSRSPLLPKSA